MLDLGSEEPRHRPRLKSQILNVRSAADVPRPLNRGLTHSRPLGSMRKAAGRIVAAALVLGLVAAALGLRFAKALLCVHPVVLSEYLRTCWCLARHGICPTEARSGQRQ